MGTLYCCLEASLIVTIFWRLMKWMLYSSAVDIESWDVWPLKPSKVRTRRGNDFEHLLASSFSEIPFDNSGFLPTLEGLFMVSTDPELDNFISTAGDGDEMGGVWFIATWVTRALIPPLGLGGIGGGVWNTLKAVKQRWRHVLSILCGILSSYISGLELWSENY